MTARPPRPGAAPRRARSTGQNARAASAPAGHERADDQPRISLLFEFFVTSQKIRHLLNRAMADSPLRADEYAVYSVLVDLGPQTPTAMARTLGMPLTTLMEYVRTMLSRGDARRSPNPADRRSYLLALTPRGRRSHSAAGRAMGAAKIELAAALSLPESAHARALHDLQRAADEAGRSGAIRSKRTA